MTVTHDAAVLSAQHQTSVAPDKILHSANAGVIVERVGQLRGEFRSEGRQFARELAEYMNTNYAGLVTVFLYEETFGTKDLLHWFIHLKSFDAYDTLLRMGTRDEGWRDLILRHRIPAERGGGGWERMFLDAGLSETVLLPQFTGMYGTGDASPPAPGDRLGGAAVVPPAQHQTKLAPEEILHSANAGIVIHRYGQLRYGLRAEGRQFARDVAEMINEQQRGEVTVFLYEEAFGRSDRIHWLLHLRSLSSYYAMIDMRAFMKPEVLDVYTRERIAPEKGGGTWDRMFIDATLTDIALTPQHWGMHATAGAKSS
ncbi:DUF6039 family protein [Dactylosporangium sp. NPDC000244]|uniref:DUF6039 family protein n=1 Tax=Dactylosporangium sp. NPDC000244 TaxID=3154365 RepID=UPI00331DD707